MPEEGNTLSRNPNVCASCSSMADGMETSNLPEIVSAERVQVVPPPAMDDGNSTVQDDEFKNTVGRAASATR